jgi:hypothetical protein
MQLLAEINLERILNTLVSLRPAVAVIDSIQTVWSDAMQSAPGSVAQVRECAAQLTRFAKQSGTCVILVGHVTKEGSLAGPRVLEHMVDTVLYFEGDTHSSFRLVRAVKNRFGAVNELGVFAMTEKGLRGVSNPSALFLSQHSLDVAGSCVLCTQEGTRPLLVEIQALVDSSQAPNPRRLSVGLEQNRLAMLLAVLHRHAGIVCGDQDVFVNAVGGVKIAEPAADLAVLLAIVSSLRNKPLPGKLVVFGEVGLAGEIRPAPRGQERLKEAAKLGFTHAIVPKANAPRASHQGHRGDRARPGRAGHRADAGVVNLFSSGRLALRMLARDWRAGELTVLGIALMLAVAALTSVGFLTDRVEQALKLQSHQLLGGDLLLTADHPWPDRFRQRGCGAGTAGTPRARPFPSMVSLGDATLLAEIKAVSAAIRCAEPCVPRRCSTLPMPKHRRVPQAGEAWPDERLATALRLVAGTSAGAGPHCGRQRPDPDNGTGSRHERVCAGAAADGQSP